MAAAASGAGVIPLWIPAFAGMMGDGRDGGDRGGYGGRGRRRGCCAATDVVSLWIPAFAGITGPAGMAVTGAGMVDAVSGGDAAPRPASFPSGFPLSRE